MNRIKLFCFPYAGGSAAIYNKWESLLDSKIILKPIELPGRGKRIKESPLKTLKEIVDDTFDIIKSEILNGEEYAFFGHSMGALIVHELLEKIYLKKMPKPSHVFFSGKGAPQVKREKRNYYLMDDETFKKEIMKLGGTPPNFFEYPELVEIFLPVLRNDFKIAETEIHDNDMTTKNVNITALFGESECLTKEQMEGWKSYSNGDCSLIFYEGGHFFIHNHTKEIVKMINTKLFSSVTK